MRIINMDYILHNRYYVQSQETKPLETISLFQVFESKQAVKSIWLQWFYKVLTTFRYKFIQYVNRLSLKLFTAKKDKITNV